MRVSAGVFVIAHVALCGVGQLEALGIGRQHLREPGRAVGDPARHLVGVIEAVQLDGLDADRDRQLDRLAGDGDGQQRGARSQRRDRDAARAGLDPDHRAVVGQLEVGGVDRCGVALGVAAGHADHRRLRRVGDREPAAGELEAVQGPEHPNADALAHPARTRAHPQLAVAVSARRPHDAVVDTAGVGAPADLAGAERHRGQVVVDRAHGEPSSQAGEDARARGDDELLDAPAARRHEDADAVRVGALEPVRRHVAQSGERLAERARHHRRRAAAVQVDGCLGAERDHDRGELGQRDAAAAGAAGSVDRDEQQRAPAVLEADRGARGDRAARRSLRRLAVRPLQPVAHERDVGADGEPQPVGDLRRQRVRELDRVADRQRAERVRSRLTADQGGRARRQRAGGGRFGATDDAPAGDPHLGRRRPAEQRAAVGAPRGRVGGDRAAGNRALVEAAERVGDSVPGRARRERQVQQLADAVVGDGERLPAVAVAALAQRAALDLEAERGLGVVDVEEVAVDARDRAGLVDLLGQRGALRDARRAQQVGAHRPARQVRGHDMTVDEAGRLEHDVVVEPDAWTERLGVVDERERSGGSGDGEERRGDDCGEERPERGGEHRRGTLSAPGRARVTKP